MLRRTWSPLLPLGFSGFCRGCGSETTGRDDAVEGVGVSRPVGGMKPPGWGVDSPSICRDYEWKILKILELYQVIFGGYL